MSLYDAFFDFSIQICKDFPSINPLALRKESAREFCIFMARYIKKKAREIETTGQTIPTGQKNIITVGKNKKVYYEDTGGDWIF